MATARQGDVSIHVEDPGTLTVLQVLSMTVEQLRYKLQARNLTPAGTTKPDLRQTLLAYVTLLPPEQPSPIVTAPGAAAGLAARPRTSSGQTNSASELQLQLRRLEMEAAERQKKLELEAEEKNRAHELEMKRLELAAQSGATSADDRCQAPAFHIDTAVKLIPKFNEHNIESFLLSFEKIA